VSVQLFKMYCLIFAFNDNSITLQLMRQLYILIQYITMLSKVEQLAFKPI